MRVGRAISKSLMVPCLLVLASASCATTPWQGTSLDPAQQVFAEELAVDLGAMEEVEPGLYVRDVTTGDGPAATRTSLVSIQYLTWLPDGTLIDGDVDEEPYSFRLGGDEVIRGWNQAIPGMRIGGVRRLVVRPGLAYGGRGRGKVPPGSTLVFEVKLVATR